MLCLCGTTREVPRVFLFYNRFVYGYFDLSVGHGKAKHAKIKRTMYPKYSVVFYLVVVLFNY